MLLPTGSALLLRARSDSDSVLCMLAKGERIDVKLPISTDEVGGGRL